MRQTESLHVAIHAAKGTNRMAEVGESVNITSELGVAFHSDAKKQIATGKTDYFVYVHPSSNHVRLRHEGT